MHELEHTIFGLSADDEFLVRVTEKPEEIKPYWKRGSNTYARKITWCS
jgi:hypothetical protein